MKSSIQPVRLHPVVALVLGGAVLAAFIFGVGSMIALCPVLLSSCMAIMPSSPRGAPG